jgi:cytochrome c oxidase subunit IV
MSRVQAKYRELVADVVGPGEGPDVPQGTVPPGHSDVAFAPSGPHVVPLWLLAGVLGALLFLTVVTVAVTLVDLGNFNIVVAMLIAVVKAALVVLYFMHLRWDSPFNSLILISSLLFVAIFMTFALVDSAEYQPNVDAAPITQAP